MRLKCTFLLKYTKLFYLQISVNGSHFCDYNHRIQKHRVTHLTVEQGLRCQMIRFDGQGGVRLVLGLQKHANVIY